MARPLGQALVTLAVGNRGGHGPHGLENAAGKLGGFWGDDPAVPRRCGRSKAR